MKRSRISLNIPFLLVILYSATVTGQTPAEVPPEYDENLPVSFVRSWDTKAPVQDANDLIDCPLRDAQQTTRYFDGLGRLLQTVEKQGSMVTGSSAADLVSPVIYDEFGREVYQYLPFASGSSDGLFKLTPFEQQISFYNTRLAGQEGETGIGTNGENWAYSKTNYELSPLNRINTTYAPGVNWVGSEEASGEADRHGIHIKYYANTEDDAVRVWNVTDAAQGSFGDYASPGAYQSGELYKTITVDEHGKQVIEFKDKEGRVILKKVQLTATADDGGGSGHTGWLCTYYIYDDLNRLRCVIPPKGVDLIKSNWVLNGSQVLTRLCFRYEYDHRSRMIMKKVPGADPVYMVYDIRDRLVMTQDGRNREISAPIWMVTLYDELNRPVMSGSLKDSYLNKSFSTLLTEAAQSAGYPFSAGSPPSTSVWTERTITGYDNFDGIGTLPAGLTTTFDNTWLTGDYIHTTYNSSPEYAQPVIVSGQTRGMVTWTKSVVIGYSQFLYRLYFYDDKGRLIQVKSTNYSGGTDVTTTQYNWAGQPLRIIEKHEKAGTPAQVSVVISDMIYDDLGRLLSTRKKIGNSLVEEGDIPESWTTIAANEYDALGQLAQKKVGRKKDNNGDYTAEALATLKYSYNIRGWLTGINKDYIDQDIADRYFAQELGYDKDVSLGSFNSRQYNGNISTLLWKSAGDGERRKYDLSYDAVNRLTKGNFGQYVSGSAHSALFDKTTAGMDFTEEINEYDAIGNIVRLIRYGRKLTGPALIDDLEYTYENGVSTKLSKVKDNVAADPGSGLGDFTDGNSSGDDYSYNGNGSIKKDLNKGISSIVHHTTINLPYTVTFANNKGNMEFFREADGTKLAKKVVENGVSVLYNGNSYSSNITTTTTYIGGFIYETKDYTLATLNPLDYKDRLQLVNHEEGRIRAVYDPSDPGTLTGFAYDYFIKDHLGNVRMVLTEEQKQDVYPPATLEGDINTDGSPNAAYIEKNYYTIDATKIADKAEATGITDYPNHNGNPPANNNPNSNTTANSDKLYKLKATATEGVTGLGITLKVMAGDRIDIFGRSYYFNAVTDGATNNKDIVTLSILTGLLGGPTGGVAANAHGGVTAGQLNEIGGSTTAIVNLFNDQLDEVPNTSTKPRAFINYIFFDEQFKSVASGFDAVGDKDHVKSHYIQQKVAPKNGYVYIYVSNQSQVNVFFDNLQVIHTKGAILEETHYYPFGLTMAGISSKALNNAPTNRFKYNGKEEQRQEFSDGSGLEWLDYGARMYDAQIGRWHAVDPLAHKFPWQSGYSAFDNNPINKIDPDGRAAYSPIYGTDGKFLGTDDEGLQGKAIVMKQEDFTQGMKHEDAMKKDLAPNGGTEYYKAIPDWGNYFDFYNHYNDLPNRPDYDGFVTIREGIDWAKSHVGALENPTPDNMLYLDASKLDFGNITTANFVNGVGQSSPINLNTKGNFAEAQLNYTLASTVYALGRVDVTLLNTNGNVKIVNNEATDYDWNKGGSIWRKGLINYERWSEGLNDTHGFKTFYYGTGRLRK
ncbi:MAG: RHS repeat-associated core domain-containing protein [Chitinophagaceae bacterium]|nr:RHS repeat-associated core domain-containing protein [Chitinophagaceae bacterium]